MAKDVVVLPKRMMLMGDNGKYLRMMTSPCMTTPCDRKGCMQSCMQFSGTSKCDTDAKFETCQCCDGAVAIKSMSSNKFWNAPCVDPTDPCSNYITCDGDCMNQQFVPMKYKTNKVMLMNKSTGKYCKRYTNCDLSKDESLLCAPNSCMDQYCIFTVEECKD